MRAVIAGAITAAIAGGVAFAVSQSLPKEYDATAGVIVGSLTAATTDQLDVNQRLAATYAELATSGPLVTRVIERIGLSDDPARLAARIDARAPGQGIVRIKATALSPTEAVQIADVVADEILALATPVGKSASLARVVEPAALPDSPSSPRVFLNTLIAAILGLALGLGLALLVGSREAPRSPARELPSAAPSEPVAAPEHRAVRTEPRAVATGQSDAGRLATAVYVTGSTSLEPGRRYAIRINGPHLQVLGPMDLDPTVVALDRTLAEVHATANEGRLVISEPGGRSGFAVAFMSIAETTAEGLATAIVNAARAVVRP